MEGEALAFESLQVFGFDDLAWFVLDSNLGPIEVVEREVDASQGLYESYLFFHQKVSTLSFESLVGLFLAGNYYVTGFHSWELVGLAVELVLVVVWRSLVDDCLEDFLLLGDLLTIASLALVLLVDNFTLAAAVITRAL